MDNNNPIINELNWIFNNPNLLADDNEYVFPQEQQIRQLQKIQTHFENKTFAEISIPKTKRLGDYFEQLVLLYLTSLDEYKNISHRKTVFFNKQTKGEFDFLVINKESNQSTHLEVAVKFYLQHQTDENIQFLGPNSSDSLKKKLDKMLNHQINLSDQEYAKKYLENYRLPLQKLILLKGLLYYPANSNWRVNTQFPQIISPDHARGWWIKADKINTIPRDNEQTRWIVLIKPYWLSIHNCLLNNPQKLLNYKDLQSLVKHHFANKTSPLHLAELMQDSNRKISEISRGFVVHNNWPNKH